ncbi:hypothetical protein HA402_011892 [Bradysia odoriphaga]|nr:hypothetical protein HA402_011892 [Bradysia odoriphaga]
MSVGDLCEAFLSSTTSGNWNNWKESLHNIGMELETQNHPNCKLLQDAACALMMYNKPGYWNWLNATMKKLIADSTSSFDPLPVLPDYDELSSEQLVQQYEKNDGNYSKQEILYELRDRYPTLIQCDFWPDFDKLKLNLREILKSVL